MKKEILILAVFLLVIAFHSISIYINYVNYEKEMKYYRVEYSVVVLSSQEVLDTLNFTDSLCLSNSEVRVVYSPRIFRKSLLSLKCKGHEDILIAEDILTGPLMEFAEAILIGDCPE